MTSAATSRTRMGRDMTDRLRLKAADAADLSVIAACLQDALIPLSEMVYLPDEHRFLAAFTRFRRECLADPDRCEGLTQCQSVLTFERVEAVRHHGIDPRFGGVKLEFLTMVAEPGEDGLSHHRPDLRGRHGAAAARARHRRHLVRFRRAVRRRTPRRATSWRSKAPEVVARLDHRAPDFEASFARLVGQAAHAGGWRARAGRGDPGPGRGRGRRGAARVHGAVRSPAARVPSSCGSARTRSRAPWRAARRSCARRSSWRRARIAAFHRRQLPAGARLPRTSSASASACAGGRSPRSGSTCRAAPPRTRARC